jgi:hypothetical protein
MDKPDNTDKQDESKDIEMTIDGDICDNEKSFEDDIEEYGCLVLPTKKHLNK